MPEDLQNLLDRIQKDGVEKAEAEADKILAAAEAKAESITKEAEGTSRSILEKAESEAAAFTRRAEKTIAQSARDVVLSIGEALNTTLKDIVRGEVALAMTGETLKEMLLKAVESYCSSESGNSRTDILLNPDQQKEIADFFMSKFGEHLRKGLEIKADDRIVAGFKVSLVDNDLQHDFSEQAMTEALCQFLRPRLARIVRDALKTSHITESGD